MTDLFQVLDTIIKQHTATRRCPDLNNFCIMVLNFTNNASIGCGATIKPTTNVINEKDSFHLGGGELQEQGPWGDPKDAIIAEVLNIG